MNDQNNQHKKRVVLDAEIIDKVVLDQVIVEGVEEVMGVAVGLLTNAKGLMAEYLSQPISEDVRKGTMNIYETYRQSLISVQGKIDNLKDESTTPDADMPMIEMELASQLSGLQLVITDITEMLIDISSTCVSNGYVLDGYDTLEEFSEAVIEMTTMLRDGSEDIKETISELEELEKLNKAEKADKLNKTEEGDKDGTD